MQAVRVAETVVTELRIARRTEHQRITPRAVCSRIIHCEANDVSPRRSEFMPRKFLGGSGSVAEIPVIK